MPVAAKTLLTELESLKNSFGEGLGAKKCDLLRHLESASLPTAEAVLRLHEVLCFCRAHPDDARLLRQVEAMLAAFHSRRDLQRKRT